MPTTVKIGEKQKHVQIPEGWHQVKEGLVKEKDKFYNLQYHVFTDVEDEDLGDNAEWYACLIRKD